MTNTPGLIPQRPPAATPNMPSSKEAPKVSILLAHYNGKAYIEESILTVYSQTYTDFELIIVDDASNDNESLRLLIELQEKYQFELIRHTKNKGATKAFQTALHRSTGEYISILSQDDKYVCDKLEYMLGRMELLGLDALYCNGGTFSATSELEPFPDTEVLLAQNISQAEVTKLISSRDTVGSLLTQGALYRRNILMELDWIRDEFILDDWPLTIVIWRDYKTQYDPKLVYHYRIHENNTHKNYWKWWPARIQVIGHIIKEEERLNVLAFMLTELSRGYIMSSKKDDAHRIAMAALFLANSRENEESALGLLRTLSGTPRSADYTKELKNKTIEITKNFKIQNKAIRRFLKLLTELIPTKRLKKSVRKRIRI